MKRTHIQLKAGEGIPQTYIILEAKPTVAWNCSFVSFYYEEGQGIKIDVYAEDKEKIDNLIDHFTKVSQVNIHSSRDYFIHLI